MESEFDQATELRIIQEVEMSLEVLSYSHALYEDSLGSLACGEMRASQESSLTEALHDLPQFAGIVGQSETLRQVLQLVEMVAASNATVLLLGETGTGKELIARAIHDRSQRK